MYLKKILILIISLVLINSVIADIGQCVAGGTYITIGAKPEYGLNENIGDITIKLDPKVFNIGTSTITATLEEDGAEIGTRVVNFPVNSLGEAKIGFAHASPKPSTFVITVIAKDTTKEYTQKKTIETKPSLDTKLTCDAQGYINRPVSCSWKTYDSYDSKLVSSTPQISVKQGTQALMFTPTTSTSFEFQTTTLGTVDVTVVTSRDGYITDTSTTKVMILSPNFEVNFKIDTKLFAEYFNTGVTIGQHNLELYVDASGQPAPIKMLQATITTPSGQKIPITFNKVSEATFQSSYSFEQAAQTYILAGDIIFNDLNAENLPFEYRILTQEKVEPINLGWIIGGSVAFLVLIIFVAIWIRKKVK